MKRYYKEDLQNKKINICVLSHKDDTFVEIERIKKIDMKIGDYYYDNNKYKYVPGKIEAVIECNNILKAELIEAKIVNYLFKKYKENLLNSHCYEIKLDNDDINFLNNLRKE